VSTRRVTRACSLPYVTRPCGTTLLEAFFCGTGCRPSRSYIPRCGRTERACRIPPVHDGGSPPTRSFTMSLLSGRRDVVRGATRGSGARRPIRAWPTGHCRSGLGPRRDCTRTFVCRDGIGVTSQPPA
jgi:hypothetical protein